MAPAPGNSRLAFVPPATSPSSLQGRVRCERERERPLRRDVEVEEVVGVPSPLLGVVRSMLYVLCVSTYLPGIVPGTSVFFSATNVVHASCMQQ